MKLPEHIEAQIKATADKLGYCESEYLRYRHKVIVRAEAIFELVKKERAERIKRAA